MRYESPNQYLIPQSHGSVTQNAKLRVPVKLLSSKIYLQANDSNMQLHACTAHLTASCFSLIRTVSECPSATSFLASVLTAE